MRHRSSNSSSEPLPIQGSFSTFNGSCTSPESTTSVPYDWGFESKSTKTVDMYDVVTPQFQRKVHQGFIINNPMDRTTYEVVSSGPVVYDNIYRYRTWTNCSGTWKWVYHGNSYDGVCSLSGNIGAYMLPAPDIDIESLIDQAVNKAYANISASEVDSIMILAESRETVSSFISIFRKLVEILRHIRKGRVKGLYKRISDVKNIADEWMEVRYALRPLVYDVNGIINAAKKSRKGCDRVTFRGHKEESDHDTDYAFPIDKGSGCTIYVDRISRRSVEVRAGVLCRVDDLNPLSIWGFDRPLEAIWDYVPLSFVIDWFFDIGTQISSWTPNIGFHELASWVVINDVITRTVELVGTSRNPTPLVYPSEIYDARYQMGQGTVSETSTHKWRVVNPTRSILPHLNVRLDVAKLVDLMIIGKQHRAVIYHH